MQFVLQFGCKVRESSHLNKWALSQQKKHYSFYINLPIIFVSLKLAVQYCLEMKFDKEIL